ncbi:glycoside hydrolase family 16 protein [Nocardioides sp. LHG3406-4]|uniref:glycoside hydrolase family 16 protein n=1 Tax=Nocardioides sp. LHG3406-4 TaxID=2804575 RepID=UPI003CF766B5
MTSRLRALALLITGLLAMATLVAVQSPAQAAFGRLHLPTATPMAGVPFSITGQLESKVKRPVRLQQQRGSRWVTIARTTARRNQSFTFRGVVLRSDANLRAVARRFKAKVKLPKIVTKAVAVPVLVQRGRIAALPPVAQQGTTPSAPAEGPIVSAGFTPARPGRTVQLQQQRGGGWETVRTAPQDRSGYAVFEASAGKTYRAVTVAAGGAPAYTTDQVTAREWKPAFEDTFSGPTLNPALWQDQTESYSYDTGIRTCARQDPSVRAMTGETLELGIGYDTTRAGQNCHYTSAYGEGDSPYLLNTQVATQKSFTYRYGYVAARIRFAAPQGAHSCFWILPEGGKVPGDPARGAEVDVAEFFGEGGPRDAVGGFIHTLDSAGNNEKLGDLFKPTSLMKPTGDSWSTSYHVFSLEWTPQEYVFRVDGREFWRTSQRISQADEYLVLSMLTSNYELRYLTPETLAAKTSVDWVRVWKS